MLVLICYDISSNRRRRRLAALLEGYGRRVQRSVFECEVAETRLRRLQAQIVQRRLVRPPEESIRYYRLCASCAERVEPAGRVARGEVIIV